MTAKERLEKNRFRLYTGKYFYLRNDNQELLKYLLAWRSIAIKYKIDPLPEAVGTSHVNIDYYKAFPKKEAMIIHNFINTLSAQSHIDLTNFYANLRYLTLKFKPIKDQSCIITHGIYDSEENTIVLASERYETLCHELLHMASFSRNEQFVTCGFQRYKTNKNNSNKASYNIGEGINEGYTGLLTTRYFAPYGDEYSDLRPFVETIEFFVGKNTMENLYFKGDLLGLVNKMQETMGIDTDTVKKIISKIDLYFDGYAIDDFNEDILVEIHLDITKTFLKILLSYAKNKSEETLSLDDNVYYKILARLLIFIKNSADTQEYEQLLDSYYCEYESTLTTVLDFVKLFEEKIDREKYHGV